MDFKRKFIFSSSFSRRNYFYDIYFSYCVIFFACSYFFFLEKSFLLFLLLFSFFFPQTSSILFLDIDLPNLSLTVSVLNLLLSDQISIHFDVILLSYLWSSTFFSFFSFKFDQWIPCLFSFLSFSVRVVFLLKSFQLQHQKLFLRNFLLYYFPQ